MKPFTTEDFSGSGQYLVRMSPKEIYLREKDAFANIERTGFLTTVMYKVCYDFGHAARGHTKYLVAMSDGMIYKRFETDSIKPIVSEILLVDYLNNEKNEQWRFATQEEVVRAVMYQSSRWRN